MPRAALMLGKAISVGVRGLSQAAIIYALAWLVGGQINWHPFALVGVLAVVLLGAACFSRSLRGCIRRRSPSAPSSGIEPDRTAEPVNKNEPLGW
jgi:hypothetical protein